MLWHTHLMSGVLIGYYVTNDWKGALVGGVGAIVSDLDEPKSKFGKALPFISYPLKKKFGHRTLTHSAIFAFSSFVLLAVCTFNLALSLAFALGIVAHAIGDMLTGRVQFLYPHPKKIGIKMPMWLYYTTDTIISILLLIVLVYEFAYYF